MVANILQVTPQDKVQSKKAKVKKNTNFATLLNDKIEKKQKISKETPLQSVENKEALSKKIQNQKDKKDARLQFTQKTSKVKKPKLEQTQTMGLVPIPTDQTFALKESLPHKDQVKKLKSNKKIIPTQSTQEQLALHTLKKTHSKKPLTPLKEALQTPPQSQSHEQKTLGDVVKLAEGLNLTKLQLKEEKPHKQEKIPQVSKEEISNLINRTNKAPLLQTLLTKESFKSQKTQEISKNEYKHIDKGKDIKIPQSQELPKELKSKDIGLNELLKTTSKEKLEVSEERIAQEEKKSEKTQDFSLNEIKRETQFKIASSKEMFTQFSQRIREEILNYKPPFTKLSMELNPAELGKLEITITKKGKELQINVNANNAHALQTFMQNQNEFRATLSNAGFNNVELNFSQGEGRGGESKSQEQQQQKRNKNSLEETITEIPALASMEIKMVQYA